MRIELSKREHILTNPSLPFLSGITLNKRTVLCEGIGGEAPTATAFA